MPILHPVPLNDKGLHSGWWSTGDYSLQSFRVVLSPPQVDSLQVCTAQYSAEDSQGDPLQVSGAPFLSSSLLSGTLPHTLPDSQAHLQNSAPFGFLLPNQQPGNSPASKQRQPGGLNAFFPNSWGSHSAFHCLMSSVFQIFCLVLHFSGKRVKMAPFISSWLEMEV